MDAIKPIARTLFNVEAGPEVRFHNLSMLPLAPRQARAETPAPYATLDEALALGHVEITEISDAGSVPELRVINRGDRPTLIIDGEELVGAKQNRIVNLSILIPALAKLTIPVSCVEAGRWSARSRAFAAAPRTQYATGRARRMEQVSDAMRSHGARHADQADIWNDIALKSERMNARSETGAMDALFLDHASFVEKAVEAFAAGPKQTGALFAVSGRLLGFDLFDRASTLRKLLPKLVRAAAVDALDTAEPRSLKGRATAKGRAAASTLAAEADQLFAALSASPAISAPAIGQGEDVRISAPGLTAAALVDGNAVIHLSAFRL